jgi:hypothetical protein
MESADAALFVPEYAAARGTAGDLCAAQLPDDASTARVTLDLSCAAALGQGFLDELCKQVLEVRGAAALDVSGATERMSMHLLRSAKLRGFPERLTVAERTTA